MHIRYLAPPRDVHNTRRKGLDDVHRRRLAYFFQDKRALAACYRAPRPLATFYGRTGHSPAAGRAVVRAGSWDGYNAVPRRWFSRPVDFPAHQQSSSSVSTVAMTSGGPTDVVDMATSHEPKVATPYEKEISLGTVVSVDGSNAEYPTEEELATLTRVSGQVPWSAYTIAFVELCERFGYYGCTVVYVNFIQQDMPLGSNTGAGFGGQSGALGMGQRASFGLTTCKFAETPEEERILTLS